MRTNAPVPSHRPRGKALGVPELIAIALGGMVGGGIFTVLGISVAMVGAFTPLSIAIGGLLAALAAYSYVKLGVHYQDEGATYSFYKLTFPRSPFAAALIGWWVVFGYISTLALYAYTFASYAISGFAFAGEDWLRKLVAGGVIAAFTAVNLWSVRGMGKVEDLMVYTKLIILLVIAAVLIHHGNADLPVLLKRSGDTSVAGILIAAALTFVAYEGFQLVINAVNEMTEPERNIPRAIYTAIAVAVTLYVVIAIGAILAIPFEDIVRDQEYALAAGAKEVLGHWGRDLVIAGAMLATSSAISGTVFGASRQLAAIATDGYLPVVLARRRGRIPRFAILTMAGSACLLVLAGNLQVILEFGSLTFLLVSWLMAYANFTIRKATGSSTAIVLLALVALSLGTALIVYYQATEQPEQLGFTGGLFALLTLGAWLYSRRRPSAGVLGPGARA